MALSKEWEISHLTPRGWERGDCKYDNGKTISNPVPEDAVLSIQKYVTWGALGVMSSRDSETTETRIIDDDNVIHELREKYGEPHFGI